MNAKCRSRTGLLAVSPISMCCEPAVILIDRRMLYGVNLILAEP